MPDKDTKVLEIHQYQQSDKARFIIFADLECKTETFDGCKNDPENLSLTKVNKHIPSCFLMSTISSFKSIKKS